VEILSNEKPSDTQRSGELRFYFMPVVPDELTLKILGPKQRIHRLFKGQCRASGYKECVRVNKRATAGLETWVYLDKSIRGELLWKVYLQKETKEGGNGQLSLHGALCHDLTSNFSCTEALPETIFLFKRNLEVRNRHLFFV
jgi:hypothetical protein